MEIKFVDAIEESNGDTIFKFEIPYDLALSLEDKYGHNYESILSAKFAEYVHEMSLFIEANENKEDEEC